MHKSRWLLLLFLIPFLLFAIPQNANAQGGSSVLKITLDNDIGLAEELMFDDAINYAQQQGVDLIVVELSTPGGTVDAVLEIMGKFERSSIPICIWIPVGAGAWSGGTYLLMASHIAAMASPSFIGSCQPVGDDGLPITDSKYINPLIATIVRYAELHNRNTTIAEQFITQNLNLDDQDALNFNVTEFQANSLTSLLNQLNNYTLLKNITGQETYYELVSSFGGPYPIPERINFTYLDIKSANIIPYNPSISYHFIRFITNPTVVSIFLTVGSFGLIIGLTTTNTHLDEIVGGIALVIGLIGIGIIGIAVGAIILFAIGLAFFLLEIKFDVGFNGSLAIGGGVCIAIASLFIIPSSAFWAKPEFLASAKWSAFGISVAFIAFFSVIAIKVLETKGLKSELDVDRLCGARGYVKKELKPEGQVIVKAEQWSAIALEGNWPIAEGEDIEVVKIDGLRLIVKRVEE